MNYIIQVIDRAGNAIHSERFDEKPNEDQLRDLAKLCGGAFCDVARIPTL